MAPLHHHFELIGWSEPKVITRFVIVGDHLRAVQPDDVEAAMTADMPFSVARQARDGRRARREAASRPRSCSSRRGARVTLTDVRAASADEDAAARARRDARARRPRRRDVHRRRSRSCSARACRPSSRRSQAARDARRAGHRRDRAGVALAAGRVIRDHRHEGQVDDDDADRPDARGRRPSRDSSAATSARR